jgi:hypothetical protein
MDCGDGTEISSRFYGAREDGVVGPLPAWGVFEAIGRAFGNPGPSHGKMTRFKATLKLLQLCAAYGITPDTVNDHFRIEYKMPSELVQLTSPSRRTPTKPRTTKLRSEFAELNELFAKHTFTCPTIRHIGWVRKFHLAHHPDFRWNKGSRPAQNSPMSS